MKEVWREIVGTAYSVSDQGRVRRDVPHRNTRDPHGIVRNMVNSRGYVQVTLHGRSRMVHRLVAEAFLGAMPPGQHTNHRDGVKTNNHRRNLEYVTPRENIHHAVRLGLKPRGESHYAAQLGDSEVLEIRSRYVRGAGKGLADEFGVSYNTIMHIAGRRSWRHL